MKTTRLIEEQVLKAATAILAYTKRERQKAEEADDRAQLFYDDEIIHLNLTIYRDNEGPLARRKLRNNKLHKIEIKHPIMMDKDICIIAGYTEEHKQGVIKKLQETPVSQVKRVISAHELREKFCQIKDKRALCEAYDFFMADSAIIPTITHDLGKHFFLRNKQPFALKMHGAFQKRIMKALHCTFALKPKKTQMSVKIATDSFTAQQITDNVMMAVDKVVKLIPKGWLGVKTVGLKTVPSPILVVYRALLPDNQKESTESTQVNKEKSSPNKKEDKKMDTESCDNAKKPQEGAEDGKKMVTESSDLKKKPKESVEEEDNKMKTDEDS